MHSLGPRVHIASIFRAREDDVNCESLGAGQNGEWYSDPTCIREPWTDRGLFSCILQVFTRRYTRPATPDCRRHVLCASHPFHSVSARHPLTGHRHSLPTADRWHPDREPTDKKVLLASHPELQARFLRESALRKSTFLADIDFIDVTTRSEIMNSVQGAPAMTVVGGHVAPARLRHALESRWGPLHTSAGCSSLLFRRTL